MNTWNLRDEILAVTHRWYVIFVFMLAGALVGWTAGTFWPAPYRASLNLYVGINAYRSPYASYAATLARQSFRLVDDYKNWQMEQLNALVLTDPYMQAVLDRLQAGDAYWLEVSVQDLREDMKVLWRNAGEWHLVYENDNPDRAEAAVVNWAAVIQEGVGEAISHSKQVVALDVQMTSLVDQRVASQLRLDKLQYVKKQLVTILEGLGKLPEDGKISPQEHENILALISLIAEWKPGWDSLLDDAPPIGSDAKHTTGYLEEVLSLIEVEVSILPGEIEGLDEAFDRIAGLYETETASSYGLASTLVIERISTEKPAVEAVVPNSLGSLLGGIAGMIAWGTWFFMKISLKKP